jgi:Acyclic terpene utilisation family protein AtuA
MRRAPCGYAPRVPDPLRIAGASGFWGDRNDALLDQVRGGPVDVVMLDYLAEVTMSILRLKKARDPSAGYAVDFLDALAPALAEITQRGIRVTTNAGGMNPRACAEAVVEMARRAGLRGLRVGIVTGDDIVDRLDAIAAEGASLAHMDTGAPFAGVRERVRSANVYLGAAPIARALREGAQIVVTGRCTDSALALGPLLAHFDWVVDDWDRLAAGVIAGHLLECGAQASGGNFAGGWPDVPDLARIGYPIADVDASGRMVISKHPGLGGRITPAALKEQLLYEIGDPRAYRTPDVTADFTTLALRDLGGDRVEITGVTGSAAPAELKVSISYDDGWRNAVTLVFVWPGAIRRARATEELLLERCRHVGIRIEAHHTDLVGVSGAHGPMAPPPSAEPNEVLLRMAVRTRDRESARRFAAEVAPMILCGVPGASAGTTSGRADPAPIVNFWPALVPRGAVTPEVEVIEA